MFIAIQITLILAVLLSGLCVTAEGETEQNKKHAAAVAIAGIAGLIIMVVVGTV